jgi:hypothetical protein
MKQPIRISAVILSLCLLTPLLAAAQQSKPGVLSSQEIKRVVPTAYFYGGQSAGVQIRNCAGFSTANGKLVLAGLVDNSGYSTDVAAKYQGFLITEVKLNVGGTELVPGQYGFGFTKDGKFYVMDVGSNELVNTAYQTDEKLARPVPLKIVAEGETYRLYHGREFVSLKAE